MSIMNIGVKKSEGETSPPPGIAPTPTQMDSTWRAAVEHENLLQKRWRTEWATFTHLKPLHRGVQHEFDTLKPPTREKTKEGCKEQFMDKIVQNPLLKKFSFIGEQYGHYRELKYMLEFEKSCLQMNKSEGKEPKPTSRIRHRVNPLLC